MVHAVASDDTNDDTEEATVEVAELNAKVGVSRRTCASADSSSTVKTGKRSSGDAQVPVSVLVVSVLAVHVFKAFSSVFTCCANKMDKQGDQTNEAIRLIGGNMST